MKRAILLFVFFAGVGALGLLLFFSKPAEVKIETQQQTEITKPAVEIESTPQFFTYYYNRSSVGFDSLQKNANKVDVVIAEALKLKTSTGEFVEVNSSRQIEVKKLAKDKGTGVHALFSNNDGGWQAERTAALLADSEARKRTALSLSQYIAAQGYQGLSLDFEKLSQKILPSYYSFLAELNEAMGEKDLSVHFYINDKAPDYAELAKHVDYIILMAYDQHDTTTGPGPIAAAPWIKENLEQVLATAPASKLVLGLANYAYDWSEDQAQSKAVLQAQALARQKGLDIEFDQETLNSKYSYEENGNKHQVWLLDQSSVKHSLDQTSQYKLAGYALFRTGSEDPLTWQVFGKQK
jgi:peptidoglycan-N-acetylglucosamine deacetylase